MENLGQLDGLREQNNGDLVSSLNVIYEHFVGLVIAGIENHLLSTCDRVLLVGATYCTYTASQFRLNSIFSHKNVRIRIFSVES